MSDSKDLLPRIGSFWKDSTLYVEGTSHVIHKVTHIENNTVYYDMLDIRQSNNKYDVFYRNSIRLKDFLSLYRPLIRDEV